MCAVLGILGLLAVAVGVFVVGAAVLLILRLISFLLDPPAKPHKASSRSGWVLLLMIVVILHFAFFITLGFITHT